MKSKKAISIFALLFIFYIGGNRAYAGDDDVFSEKPLEVIKKEPYKRRKMIKEPLEMPFYVFNNSIYPPVKNFAPSGYMGDIPDVKLTGSYTEVLQEGYPSLKVTYLAQGAAGWSGTMWQNPPNNWGELDGGYNLIKAGKLTFWAKGKKGGEVVEFKLGGTLSNYPDSANLTTGEIALSDVWTQYTLVLEDVELQYISAGFGFVIKQENNPEKCTFFLDDIKYEE